MHLLLAARLTIATHWKSSIARHWKSSTPPTLLEAIELTNTYHSYELMMAASSGKLQQTLKKMVPVGILELRQELTPTNPVCSKVN